MLRRRSLLCAALAAAACALVSPATAAPLRVSDVAAAPVSPTAVRVGWRAPGATRSWIEVGRTPPYAVWVAATPGAGGAFEATIEGLEPATPYGFRIVARDARASAESSGAVTTAGVAPSARAGVRDGRIQLDGHPFLPVMAWGQCGETYDELLALGVNLFLGGCPLAPTAELLRRLDGRAYSVIPVADRALDAKGVIGWNYPDEPEGWGIPSTALPDLPPPSDTGRLRFLTVTYHFYDRAEPIAPWVPKDTYPGYFAKADVLGFDLYPLAKYCYQPILGLPAVYEAARQLTTVHVPGRPTYQWIETGPLEGECRTGPQLTPQILRTEAWLALAGGATGIGWFTHTWTNDVWRRFDVAPEIQRAIAAADAEISAYSPALLGRELPFRAKADGRVKIGVRSYGGAVYVIAVNSSRERTAASWTVPALATTTVDVAGESRTLAVRRGTLSDRFEPHAVHVYVTKPVPPPAPKPKPKPKAVRPG